MSEDGRRVVAFYEGTAPDDRGRFHEVVLRFDDENLEYVHDFFRSTASLGAQTKSCAALRFRSAAQTGCTRETITTCV